MAVSRRQSDGIFSDSSRKSLIFVEITKSALLTSFIAGKNANNSVWTRNFPGKIPWNKKNHSNFS
jgi:hypothetical protein